jgi:hypothetical protein
MSLNDIATYIKDTIFRLPVVCETALPQLDLRLFRFSSHDFRIELDTLQETDLGALYCKFVLLATDTAGRTQKIRYEGEVDPRITTSAPVTSQSFCTKPQLANWPDPSHKSIEDVRWIGIISSQRFHSFKLRFQGLIISSDPPPPLVTRIWFLITTCKRHIIPIAIWGALLGLLIFIVYHTLMALIRENGDVNGNISGN